MTKYPQWTNYMRNSNNWRGRSFLYDTIDTSRQPHTADYLTSKAHDFISSCKTKHNCTISSFVTDNAANMTRMRENIKEMLQIWM